MRTRHQDGWVELRGKRAQRWYGHYYVYARDVAGNEHRRHIGISLGDKSKLRKWEAEAKLRNEIAKACKGVPTGAGLTLAWFTHEKFLPMRKPQWALSTRETNLYHIESHILPKLGEKPLAELDKFACQTFLNERAEAGFSFTVVDHCRTMLHAILDEALDAELISKNPARKLVNPDTPEPDKPVLEKAHARQLIESLEFRDRLISMIASFCAMRPGEIFGLRWSSWRDEHFQIEGTAWRGKLRPGKAKTKGSKAPVAIPEVVLPLLKEWREQNREAANDALIFPSEKGTPMRPENWLRRRVKPLARAAGITGPINFQVMRRTFATNAQAFGNAKDVQCHLRHTDIATTMNEYTQPVAASVRNLVNDVALDVMTTPMPQMPTKMVQ